MTSGKHPRGGGVGAAGLESVCSAVTRATDPESPRLRTWGKSPRIKAEKTNRMVIFVPHKDKLHTKVSQKPIMSPGLPSIQEVPKTNKPPKPFLCQR